MKKKKPGFYFCSLWRMNYYFFLGWTPDEYAAYMLEEYNMQIEIPSRGTGQINEVVSPGKYGFTIWVMGKTDYPCLAHECLHAANYTLSMAGWHYDVNNHEPQTYLMTNLIRKALGRV